MTDRELMQQALESIDWLVHHLTQHHGCLHMNPTASGIPAWLGKTEAVLRAAIEQAQEPVAWMYHGIRHDDTPHERPSLIWKPEYMDVMSAEKGAKATPLYTAPRQWQGLTEQEIKDCEKQAMVNGSLPFEQRSFFARAIEAKLREKNNAR